MRQFALGRQSDMWYNIQACGVVSSLLFRQGNQSKIVSKGRKPAMAYESSRRECFYQLSADRAVGMDKDGPTEEEIAIVERRK